MKKLALSIVFTSFTLISSKAQNIGEFQYGIGGGLNISSIIFDTKEDIETGSLSSFNIALSGEYYFSDRLGIKTKVIYDNKGWTGKVQDSNSSLGEPLTADFNLTYITIPLMVNYHFGSLQSRAKSFVFRPWYVSLGPYIGVLAKAEESETSLDFKESLKSVDYGAALNFGIRFEVADFTKLYIEYDGQYGFADIAEDYVNTDQRFNYPINNGFRHSFNLGLLFAFY